MLVLLNVSVFKNNNNWMDRHEMTHLYTHCYGEHVSTMPLAQSHRAVSMAVESVSLKAVG